MKKEVTLKRCSKGFSLIEVFLVLAIIAVLLMLGLTMAQKYAQEVAVKKTATQLKQVLEAGLNYYRDNNNWPICPPDLNFKKYLEFEAFKNPWGNDYECSIIGEGNKLQVATVLPSSNLARRVKALLPNAVVEENRILVDVLKSPAAIRLYPVILNIGSIRLDKNSPVDPLNLEYSISVVVSQCPANWKQGMIVTPMNIEVGSLIGGVSHNFNQVFSRAVGLAAIPDCKKEPSNPDSLKCFLKIKFNALKCGYYRADKSGYPNICPGGVGFGGETTMLQDIRVWELSTLNPWGFLDDSGVFEAYYINYCIPPK